MCEERQLGLISCRNCDVIESLIIGDEIETAANGTAAGTREIINWLWPPCLLLIFNGCKFLGYSHIRPFPTLGIIMNSSKLAALVFSDWPRGKRK